MTTLSDMNVESVLQGVISASINYDFLVTLVLGLVLSSFIITACWFVFNSVINLFFRSLWYGKMKSESFKETMPLSAKSG